MADCHSLVRLSRCMAPAVHLPAVHLWQRPSPRQSRVASNRAAETRHKLSGQRMRNMKTHQASGRASALRVGHTIAPTANFKTRSDPCRIAVRADLDFPSKRSSQQHCITRERGPIRPHNVPRHSVAGTLAAQHRGTMTNSLRIHSPHDSEKPVAQKRFPYAACRCNSTGLLEQMP